MQGKKVGCCRGFFSYSKSSEFDFSNSATETNFLRPEYRIDSAYIITALSNYPGFEYILAKSSTYGVHSI